MKKEDIIESAQGEYTDDNIIHLDDREHIRRRPGMYIGKLGDGKFSDDGIYVLIKETIDNSIDEFRMGEGKVIEVNVDLDVPKGSVRVRDYGRGIPLGKMVDAVSLLNTGGKYDTKSFKKSVGMNGVGTKAVNALSEHFVVASYRDGMMRRAEFERGHLVSDTGVVPNETNEARGTYIQFQPDDSRGLFENYQFRGEFIETMLRNYSYLNTGLTLKYNGQKFHSKDGLFDLLKENMTAEPLYPIIHLQGEDIEIALTHTDQSGEEYFSFVNGQHTIQGGTHQAAYREAIGKTIKEFFAKNMELSDIRNGIVGAIAINVEEPTFESQTKIKLGSRDMSLREDSISINKFVNDFLKKELDNYLHKTPETVATLLQKIQDSEKERKAIAGVTKLARERAKKNLLNNPKLRDCRIHLNDAKPSFSSKDSQDDLRLDTCIFITEGLSASGSITKSRDVNTQAVFSLRGKPLNSYGLTKKVVYENEEFNCLQSALNIEDGLDDLRYNKVIIATDADVDGMHIRLLMLTFFLQFFPDLVKKGHVYILQTPLFRVKNKQEIRYCYSEEERVAALAAVKNPEITRFKGLGEISPDEFTGFIGKNIRLDQVSLQKSDSVHELLNFYMGKNTTERQNFIIENLVVEQDDVEGEND
ncbi:MAG: type IIA DNA topoisomerase subunit B [Paludibacteraceae bacterium]|nr:type IIA DNA topoisomerase subunit B [Paludibacteraceae bacterium]